MQKGIRVFYIDGRQISSKAEFLSAIAEAMQFPDYFGHNWDTLDECLTDLSWCLADKYVVIYDQPDCFSSADPEGWRMAKSVLQSAEAFWQNQGRPMHLFLLS
jgi:Barstar (barnase inhibitor)